MSKLVMISGFDGVDGRGRRIIVAHSYNAWGEDRGYGVWVLCENYKLGRMISSWRYIVAGVTKEDAIAVFKKRNKA